MADTDRKAAGWSPPTPNCPRCEAHDDCIPLEIELQAMVAGVSIDQAEFMPTPSNSRQAAAEAMLAMALNNYIRELGVGTAGARLAVTTACLRVSAKYAAIQRRILEARSGINRRARARLEVHDDEAAAQILAEPTPDYPGKDQDDAWLAEGMRQ